MKTYIIRNMNIVKIQLKNLKKYNAKKYYFDVMKFKKKLSSYYNFFLLQNLQVL